MTYYSLRRDRLEQADDDIRRFLTRVPWKRSGGEPVRPTTSTRWGTTWRRSRGSASPATRSQMIAAIGGLALR